jgi:hypothetical protein
LPERLTSGKLPLLFVPPTEGITPDVDGFGFSGEIDGTGGIAGAGLGNGNPQFLEDAMVDTAGFEARHLSRPDIEGEAAPFEGGGTAPWDNGLVKYLDRIAAM